MPSLRAAIAATASGSLRVRIALIGFSLAIFTLGVWAWAFAAFATTPLLMGSAVIAFGLGLRHAVDADHIAAIDNVTRKLMQEGRRPVSVGLWFSLGHSTVVFALSAGLAAAASALKEVEGARALTGFVGTGVSALFMFAIAGANAVILAGLWRAFRRLARGIPVADSEIDVLLADRGFLARLFRRLFRLIGRSWHMYPLGFLFGLGFETATEVGVLAISATEASRGLSLWAILALPALFSAGMALVDTADGILMLGAYGWAFLEPVRKLTYNLVITSVSVLAALIVGGIETLGLIGDQLRLEGPIWSGIAHVQEDFGILGYGIIGLFAFGWLVSLALYRRVRNAGR